MPGWSPYYLDYKFLKKIVSSLAAKRPGAEAAALALGMRPADILSPTPSESDAQTPLASHHNIWEASMMITDPDLPPIAAAIHGEDTSLDFQAHKAAFFFKLERELEKVRVPSTSRSCLDLSLIHRCRSTASISRRKRNSSSA